MRRRIAILLLLLIGGAVVNVAVAWGCVFWSVQPFVIRTEPDPSIRTYVDWTWIHFEDSNLSWLADVPADWPTSPTRRGGKRTLGLTLQRASAGGVTIHSQAVFEAGLPFRALFAERHAQLFISFSPSRDRFWAATTWRDGLEIPPPTSRMRQVDVLPTLPIWPGFIINTIVYALLLWLLFFAPFAARRMIRRRRGLCEKCAYPIGVSPLCTECGAAVPARRDT